MPHRIEPAASGRARCRGCGAPIAARELRLGEAVPNAFAEGETTHWFHLDCGAYRSPEALLEALSACPGGLPDAARLESEARRGRAHRRLHRIDGAERSPTGRSRCRACRELVDRGAWRIRLVFREEDGRFSPSGSIHLACAESYFGTADLVSRLLRFSPDLGDQDVSELRRSLAVPPPGR